MKILIETPNPRYNDVTQGVQFVNGKAEIEDAQLAKEFANNWGYQVTEIKEKKQESKKANVKKSKK